MTHRSVKFEKDEKNLFAKKRPDRKEHDRDAQTLKGLCANCAKRSCCLLPEREGGVWHCEEYVEEQ